MKFSEIVEQASELLQRKGRITYRALKREFDLDDGALEDLKYELIEGQELAVDKDGKMLVWKGAEGTSSPSSSAPAPSQPPASYTPPYLAERIRAEQVALEARGSTDGERKTITALFADLKGSTALIEGLDPEEARSIIDPALQLMMDAVHRYEGYVAQALGDGIFALFGAPLAHEDHPQRALFAALRMQEEMRRYADTLRAKGYPPLLMRVGLNTGEVVVRSIRKDDLHTDYSPVGHSVHLAARMEQLAAPGSILVTAYTHKLTDGYFEFKALGPTQIKGVEEPLQVYEVLGAGLLRTRLQVASRRGLTRFVGRQSEMGQLRQALERAKAGHGQIVGVMGEPGLGKSRLFYEFKLLSQAGGLLLEAYSVSHGKASAYLPVMELLKSYFRIELRDDERTRREKVGGKVLMLDRSLEDTLPYLFALLGIEEQPSPLQQMDPQIRRRRTFEAIKRLLLRESLTQPLILIFEDLHWIDGETQGLLDVLSESVASAKVLLLVNYRPEYRHAWGQKTYYTQLRLAPFGQAEAEEFLEVLLGDTGGARQASPFQILKHLILEKTEGTPFFMEEVVQELREQGVLADGEATGRAPLPTELHIPPTVQGVLAARIDRLTPDEKGLLQQLAVIGREFPVSLLRHVITQPEDEVYRILASLQRKEFLYEQPAFPEVEYSFKHALTQEVAYGSVLQEHRKAIHERTAQAIEALYGATLDEHYSELAHHYSRSGNVPKAVEYLGRTGARVAQQGAHAEAIGYFTRALELLRRLPDGTARDRQELDLQMALSWSLFVARGPRASELKSALVRARELCEHVGEKAKLMEVLLALAHYNRRDFGLARELAERVLAMAQQAKAPAMLAGAHYILGLVRFGTGQFPAAREHLERAVELFGAGPWRNHSAYFAQSAPNVLVAVLLCLGYPLAALGRAHELLAAARRTSDPYTIATALFLDGMHHVVLRDTRILAERADEMLSIATEHEMPVNLIAATFFRGRAMAAAGRGEEGIAEMRRGISDPIVAEAFGIAPLLVALAETCGKNGRAEEGLDLVAKGLALAEQTGLRVAEAELHRIKGELLMATDLGKVTEAQCSLRTAIDVAHRQGARLFELRATVSLARLLRDTNRRDEARTILAEIYGWFTEGFDTKDLQEAKALLNELAASPARTEEGT